MKLNPKIAKQPEDLQNLEFKKMKALIKKELKRLEKYTTPEKPTQCILLGAHPYKDKPDMALPLFGKWKGKFKEYAKKTVVKDPLGAIGSVYYDGTDESGQKVVRIQLAKGKGKNKVTKIQRTLKKLIPQATYNVFFSEISEDKLNELEAKLDTTTEQEEVFEEPDYNAPEVSVDVDQNIRQLLISNFKELSNTYQLVKTDILARLRSRSTQDGDLDIIINMGDLGEEWMIIYNSANTDIQAEFAGKKDQVQKLLDFFAQLQAKLKEGGVLKDTIPSLFREGETPAEGMDEGLSSEAIKQMFSVQGLRNNCDATARYMVYKYMRDRGLMRMNDSKLLTNGRLSVYDNVLNQNVQAIGEHNFQMNRIFSPDGRLEIVQEGKTKGSYIPHPNFGKAINYIDKHVANGIPLVVGISHTHRQDQGYNEGSTDHFIVIVGKKGKGYYYIDPGTSNGAKVEENFLAPVDGTPYLFRDESGAMSSRGDYVLTTVAVFGKDRASEGGNDDWQDDDGLPSDGSGLDENAVGSGVIKASVGRGGKNSYRDAIIVQRLLVKAGENLGTYGPNKDGVDGDPGDTTYQAIDSFQRKKNLAVTGLIEPNSNSWIALYGGTDSTSEENTNEENSNQQEDSGSNDNNTTVIPGTTTGDPNELVEHAPARLIAEVGPNFVAQPQFQKNHGGPNGWYYNGGNKKWPTGKPIPKHILDKHNGGHSVTWCNYFVWEMSKKIFGKDDPFDGKEMSANVMTRFMENNKDKFEELPMPSNNDLSSIWRDYINKGKFVIFGYKASAGSGHVALGTPTTEEELTSLAGWKYGNIVQSGATTGKMTLAQGFSTGYLPKVKFFVYKSQEDYVKQTEIPAIDPSEIQFQFKGSVTGISTKAEQVLREILAAAGEPQAAIVNALRTAEEQANVMLMNIKAYGAKANRKRYKNPAAASKVVDAYEAAVAAGKGEQEILGAMLAVVNQVGAASLSDHCNASNPAIDIHPSSIKNKGNFEKMIKADSRVSVICPPKDTSYHIIIK